MLDSQKAAIARQKEFRAMVEGGVVLTRAEFANKLGVSKHTIHTDAKLIEKQIGKPVAFAPSVHKGKEPSPEITAKMKADYEAGMTITALSLKYRYGLARISAMSQPWHRPLGLQSAPALPERHTARLGGTSVTTDSAERSEAFLRAFKEARKGKSSKAGNWEGLTPAMERKYAKMWRQSLGLSAGKAA